jgi:hypothetical protein
MMRWRLARIDSGWWVAALLPLIGILPTLTPGVIDTADGPLHVQRIHAMGVMLADGVLYPRWIPYFHLGYGYPVFNFYPPGVFYLGGLLGLVGIGATTAFTLVAALAWILGSLGMYGLARRFFPVYAALLAAVLWSYAPSRLFEVWDQGSLPQMMAAAMIPWVLSGVIGVAQQPTRRGVLAVALPLAAMIFSHQPMTFISALYIAPLMLFAPVWAARHDWRSLPHRLIYVVAGGLLAGLLAAVFLLPLAAELRFVQASRGAEDNVAYLLSNFLRPHEIFAQPLPTDLTDLRFELPTTFGIIGGVLALPGLITLLLRKQFGLLVLLVLTLGFTLFMLVEQSLDVWLAIPFFRQLRFPERFLRMGVVLLSLAGAASLLLLPKRWQMGASALALIVVIAAALPLIYPNKESVNWANLSALDEIEFEQANATWGTTSYDEFDPIWGRNIPYGNPPEHEQYVTDPLRLVVSRVDMARYGDIMRVEEIDTDTSRVTLTQPHSVRFHQYYFPGWTAWVNGASAEIYPDDEFGLITLELPAGEHNITLMYTGTVAQHIGGAVTLTAVAAVFALAFLPNPSVGTRHVNRGGAVGAQHAAPLQQPSSPILNPRAALFITAGVIIFAFINTVIITPQTLWFRHRSPVDAPVYRQTPVHISFGGIFELLGYTLSQTDTAPGDFLDVMLFWRAEREIDREYRPVVQLVNLTVSEAWAVSEPFFPGGGHTLGYPTDRFASEVHEMRIFPTAPTYVGRVLVQMLDAATGEPLRLPDGSDRLILEPLIRLQGEGMPIADRLGAHFGDSLALHCADARVENDDIAVNLYWQVLATPAQDVVTFVHGLDANGDILEQGDRVPLNGNYPPSLWLPGQNLSDRYILPANEAITQIALGWFTPDNVQRLPATQNGAPLPDNRLLIPIGGEPCQP